MSASALVEIYLASLSGSSCAVTISPDTPLHLLKLEAQKHLRLCRGVVRSLSESTLEFLSGSADFLFSAGYW